MLSALYEFMPYGAPELISGASRRMFRATAASLALGVLAYLVAFVAVLTRPVAVVSERTVTIPYRELAAPPPLTDLAPPPQVTVAPTVAQPAMGVPVPVPDTEAPEAQTIASQQEMATMTQSVEAAPSQTLVVQPQEVEELPKLGDFVYVDEMPALVSDARPNYPPMAREAGVEGEVALRVLVGKDGRVAKVVVDQSIPLLDEAAIEAAQKWVFTPALSQNRPVAVWIVRKVRFSLSAPAS